MLKFYGLGHSGLTTSSQPRSKHDMGKKVSSYIPVSAKTISIDDYVSKTKTIPDVIKLDIENGEMQALIGSQKVISEYKPAIIMEIGDLGRDDFNSTRSCMDFLKNLGYVFFKFNGINSKIVPFFMKESYLYNDNVLCIHNNAKYRLINHY
jgi:hypothetical protein